ncbi:MAG: tetratricopeptide repeat protein [Acidobacteriaceae bacterium]|nr:tetratricopeptide repeat protein [Acidobacteriaceae bacterium]
MLLIFPSFCLAADGDSSIDSWMVYVERASSRDANRSWLTSEISKFRNYPNLDLAFRLLKSGRMNETKQELDRVLARDPDELTANTIYLLVLQNEHNYQGVIRRSGAILNHYSDFAPALMYRGLARSALGQTDEALRDFSTVAGLPGLTRRDRIFSLDTLIDLALAEHRYDQALKAIDDITRFRRDSRLYYRKGLALDAVGRADEASDALDTALELSADPAERLQIVKASGDIDRKRGAWKRAGEDYKAALRLNAVDTAVLRALADTSYQMKQYGDAADSMRKLLALRPDPLDRQYLANIFLADKNYPAATAEFQILTKEARDPRVLSYAYRSLVELARLRNDRKDAINMLRVVIANGASLEDRLTLVSLLEGEKDYPGMVHELRTILQASQVDPVRRYQIYMKLGNAYQASREYSEAASSFREASQLDRTATALGSVAQALEQNGNVDQAVAYARAAIEVQPSPDLYNRLAQLYLKAHNPQAALHCLKQAAHPDTPPDVLKTIYQQQGYLYSQSNQHEAAASSFARALELAPDDPQTQLAMAQECLFLKKYLAATAYLESLKPSERTIKTNLALAQALDGAGYLERATSLLKQVLTEVGHPSAEAAEAGLELGYVEIKQKHYNEAGHAFQAAFKDGNGQPPRALLESAQAFFAGQHWQQAADAYSSYLQHSESEPTRTTDAWEGLALTYVNLGQIGPASKALKEVIARGRDNAQIRKSLAFAFYDSHDWKAALDQFLASNQLQHSAQAIAGAARCYQKLNKPGLAIYYLKQATDEATDLPANEQQNALIDLGYLYSSVAEYAAAAAVWHRYVALRDDPAIYLRLARVRRLVGDYDGADQALAHVNQATLSDASKVEFLDERAMLAEKRGDRKASTRDLMAANQIAPADWRDYALGLHANADKEWNQALARFKNALSENPDKEDYLKAVAYTADASGNLEEAARLYDMIRVRHPDDPRWYKALGYVNMRLGRNAQASAWFRQAIDHGAQTKENTEADREEYRDRYMTRAEITRLTSNYEFTIYQGWVNNGYAHNPAVDLVGIAPFPAPSGLEFAIRPPVIGFRKGRIVQVFGRALWNNQNSFHIDTKLYQSSIGVRYKPFAGANFWFSAETLLHTGVPQSPKWLLRGLYSWNPGYEVRPGVSHWNYTLAFSDSAFFIGPLGYAAQYGEFREGRSFNFHDSLLITPHLAVDARWQSGKTLLGLYGEVGGGVSIRYLLNRKYEVQRSSFEILLQCKRGELFARNMSPSASLGYSGCTALGILRF